MKTTSQISISQQNEILKNARIAAPIVAKNYAAEKNMPNIFTAEDVEDIIGDSLVKACASFHTYDPQKSKLSTWMGTIVKNCTIDKFVYIVKRYDINGDMCAFDNDEGDNVVTVDEWGGKDSSVYYEDNSLYSEWRPDLEAERNELEERINEELDKMSEKDRRFLILSDEGYTPTEIALREGCTPGAAAKRICVLKKKLRERLSA